MSQIISGSCAWNEVVTKIQGPFSIQCLEDMKEKPENAALGKASVVPREGKPYDLASSLPG